MSYAIAWIVAAVVFLGMDAVWLTVMTQRLYRPLLGDLLAPNTSLPAAAVFYLLYISGLIYFAVAPALERGGTGRAAFSGLFFGLVAYATYDLTNQATLRGWDVRITLADIAWGMFVSATAATVAYLAAARFR